MGALVYCGAAKADCDKCPQWSEEQRKMNGCDGPAPLPLYSLEGVGDIYECPGKLVSDEVRQFLGIYGLCQFLNHLPVAGGILDQSSTFLAALSIVASAIQEQKKE